MIKKCFYCGKRYIKDDSRGWGCCNNCYYNEEIMVCRDCGREVTRFDFDDNRGLCSKCFENSEIWLCVECGREFIRKSNNDKIICYRCEV